MARCRPIVRSQVLPFTPRLARVSPPRWAMAAILVVGLGLGLTSHQFLGNPRDAVAELAPAFAPPQDGRGFGEAAREAADARGFGEAAREAAPALADSAVQQPAPPPAAGAPRVTAPAGVHAPQLALRDGRGVFGVGTDGRPSGVATSVDPAVVAMVASAAATGALPLPASFGRVQSRAGRLMGMAPRDAGPTPISPRSTFVRDGQPRFTWEAIPEATSYEVVVVNEALDVVAGSRDVHETSWTPDVPLARGAVLTWQVTAVTPAGRVTAPQPPAAEARFQVMTAAAADALVADLARCGESRVARAFALARAGLLADATPLFEDVAAQNPGDAVARRWLDAARAQQGR